MKGARSLRMPEIIPAVEVATLLAAATQDLLYLSETDEAFAVVSYPADGKPFTLGRACALLGKEANGETPEPTLTQFFSVATTDQPWHGAPEQESVRRFREVRRIFTEHLRDARVFRCGDIQIDILIVGRAADDAWVGLRTKAVET